MGLGFRVWDLKFRAQDLGLGLRVSFSYQPGVYRLMHR